MGIVMAGFHSGNMFGLLLSPLCIAIGGWRTPFVVLPLVLVPLLAAWWYKVPSPTAPLLATSTSTDALEPRTDDDDDNNNADDAEVQGEQENVGIATKPEHDKEGPIPLRLLVSSGPVWAIVLGTVVNHWGYFTYLTFLPAFLSAQAQMNLAASAVFAVLPWLSMAVVGRVAGEAADLLRSRGMPLISIRRRFQVASFVGPALALLAVMRMRASGITAGAPYVFAMIAALGLQSLGQAGFFTNPQDIAPRRAASVVGLSNTAGSVAGLVGTGAAGWILQATGGAWEYVFGATVVMYILGAVSYAALAGVENIFDV